MPEANTLDTAIPWGTRKQASTNPRFIENICNFYNDKTLNRPLRLLDLGCGGGYFVRDCLDAGIEAYGIEGSSWSRDHNRGAWPALKGQLHVGDITQPWPVEHSEFDVITAWEVIEHLEMSKVGIFLDLVKRHLAPNGMFIASTTNRPDVVRGVNLHQTMWTKEQWKAAIENAGLRVNPKMVRFFHPQWPACREDCATSFHIVASYKLLNPPKRSMLLTAYDYWTGSKLMQFITGTRNQMSA